MLEPQQAGALSREKGGVLSSYSPPGPSRAEKPLHVGDWKGQKETKVLHGLEEKPRSSWVSFEKLLAFSVPQIPEVSSRV